MTGNFGLAYVRVTVPEGATAQDISALLTDELFPEIDEVVFVEKAKPYEGYLFPDTYLFLPTVSEDEVLFALRQNFNKKILTLEGELEAFGKPLSEVVTMASLLEKEARSMTVRQTIAGILWKRLEKNMLLQVDAVFGYIKGRPTYSPSFEDLEIDSPYNTYRNKGLPPGPIGNPGLDALLAAMTPEQTTYYFYLSDRQGNMHYSTTFEEHRANREKYLQ
jgi:UPF0755 protein